VEVVQGRQGVVAVADRTLRDGVAQQVEPMVADRPVRARGLVRGSPLDRRVAVGEASQARYIRTRDTYVRLVSSASAAAYWSRKSA
jgi:hypothetical protein